MPKPSQLDTGTTLYYPYIHPRSVNDLKAALIYWDRVRRIVPEDITNGKSVYDDEDEIQLLADNDLLVSTSPKQYEEKAAETFFQHLGAHTNKFRIDIDAARELADRNRGIHIEKIGKKALERLEKLGLAHRFGDWVSMHDEVGAFYMFCLASEMGNRMGASLITDSVENATLGQSLFFEPKRERKVTTDLLRVNISLPSPEDLTHVPIKKLVKFANLHKDERLFFRQTMEDIIETVRSTADENAVEDYLDTQKAKIEESIRNLRSTLRDLNILSFASIAKITVPTGAAAAIANLTSSPIVAATLGAIGLTISAVACYIETRGKLRQAKLSSPYHYLLSMERELAFNPTKDN